MAEAERGAAAAVPGGAADLAPGELLAGARRLLGLPAARVSRAADIAQGHLGRVERGQYKVTPELLARAAGVLRPAWWDRERALAWWAGVLLWATGTAPPDAQRARAAADWAEAAAIGRAMARRGIDDAPPEQLGLMLRAWQAAGWPRFGEALALGDADPEASATATVAWGWVAADWLWPPAGLGLLGLPGERDPRRWPDRPAAEAVDAAAALARRVRERQADEAAASLQAALATADGEAAQDADLAALLAAWPRLTARERAALALAAKAWAELP
ncbi:MAG: helix-turn-helix transcriptional regulator [Actinomycetia bacterium]|nr:helix-turn-helix transcriptional regulator [Actinomycetes bacterium]